MEKVEPGFALLREELDGGAISDEDMGGLEEATGNYYICHF